VNRRLSEVSHILARLAVTAGALAGAAGARSADSSGQRIVWCFVTPEEYTELVLQLVERIPPGRVMTYGAIAEALAEVSGRNSARQVGTIMARYGGGVPWHRVVNSAGRLPPGHESRAAALLQAEGVAMRSGRVIIETTAWYPEDHTSGR
jgi:methylated-DNA-protein-cysteine methyltransferase related protein